MGTRSSTDVKSSKRRIPYPKRATPTDGDANSLLGRMVGEDGDEVVQQALFPQKAEERPFLVGRVMSPDKAFEIAETILVALT